MEMLKTGLVTYTEVVIQRTVDDVWAILPQYYVWNPSHRTATRKLLKGEPGQVGELVEILKHGASEPYYVETVRIRPLQVIEGSHKVANIVWKAYDKSLSFSNFIDFGVREFNGKTIFYESYYAQCSPSEKGLFYERFQQLQRNQAEGQPDPRGEAAEALDAYLRSAQ